jgi:hypothetical protein
MLRSVKMFAAIYKINFPFYLHKKISYSYIKGHVSLKGRIHICEKESKEMTRERLGYPGLRSGVGKAMEKGEEERKRL